MRERKNRNTHQTLYLFLGFLILFALSFSLGVIVGKGIGGADKTELAKGERITEHTGKEIALPENIDSTTIEDKPTREPTAETTIPEETQIEMEEIIEEPSAPEKATPVTPDEKVAEHDTPPSRPVEKAAERQTEESAPEELPSTDTANKEEVRKTDMEKEEPRQQKETAALPKIDPEGKYTVQVGSFQDQKKAEELLEVLKSRGYPVFLKKADIPGSGTWYRTRIGTFKTREDARLYSDNIKNREPDIVQLAFVTLND